MVFIKHNPLKLDIYFDPIFVSCFSESRFFRVPGFSGSRFFRVQVFQGPGPGFISSPLNILVRDVINSLY